MTDDTVHSHLITLSKKQSNYATVSEDIMTSHRSGSTQSTLCIRPSLRPVFRGSDEEGREGPLGGGARQPEDKATQVGHSGPGRNTPADFPIR